MLSVHCVFAISSTLQDPHNLHSVIFLDEPTSGLDASSALLVMTSLKKLVETNGVTVCAVIHQPRKVIFDLFDSLILLSVGGRMCYTGPAANAKSYFQGKGYELPEGESVADWLIDISSGALTPDEDMMAEAQPVKRKSALILAGADTMGAAVPASTMADDEYTMQADRRDQLNKAWIEYFDKKSKKITKKSRQMYYSKPEATDLPPSILKPTFGKQLTVQLDRAIKVGQRNAFYKFVDAIIIVMVGILISMMQGVTVLSIDADPQGIRLEYLVTEDPSLVLSEDNDNFFEQVFAYAMGANEDFRQ